MAISFHRHKEGHDAQRGHAVADGFTAAAGRTARDKSGTGVRLHIDRFGREAAFDGTRGNGTGEERFTVGRHGILIDRNEDERIVCRTDGGQRIGRVGFYKRIALTDKLRGLTTYEETFHGSESRVFKVGMHQAPMAVTLVYILPFHPRIGAELMLIVDEALG